jgi:hypothetical protein
MNTRYSKQRMPTRLFFLYMPESRAVNSAGRRTVQVRAVGAKKQCCTIMLAITADRQMWYLNTRWWLRRSSLKEL